MKKYTINIHKFFKEASYAPLILGIFVIFLWCLPLISCSAKKQSKLSGTEVVVTSGLIVANITTNEYYAVTLERTVKDSMMMTTTDTTNGKITQEKKLVRDTSYKVLWGFNQTDSLKQNIQSKIDPSKDSMIFRLTPINKNIVIADFNRNWPRN